MQLKNTTFNTLKTNKQTKNYFLFQYNKKNKKSTQIIHIFIRMY